METAIQVKERPILFSGEMVRAVLGGRKTQTRRVVKPQPLTDDIDNTGDGQTIICMKSGTYIKCPYGAPGDLLWVRETWDVCVIQDEHLPSMCYRADSTGIPTSRKKAWDLLRSDDSRLHKWRPSIHMPRWASRIQLEITDVHVERVQDVSEEDAEAEGIFNSSELHEYDCTSLQFHPDQPCRCGEKSATEVFSRLWNSINEKRGFGWEVNPWVWVVEFKQVEP